MRWTRETQRRPCLDYGERAAMTRSGAERALADHVQDDSPFRVDLDETNDAILRNSFRRPTHQDLSGLHADSAIGEHHCILPMPAIHAALGLSVYPRSALVKKPIGNHHSSTTYTRHHHSSFHSIVYRITPETGSDREPQFQWISYQAEIAATSLGKQTCSMNRHLDDLFGSLDGQTIMLHLSQA